MKKEKLIKNYILCINRELEKNKYSVNFINNNMVDLSIHHVKHYRIFKTDRMELDEMILFLKGILKGIDLQRLEERYK